MGLQIKGGSFPIFPNFTAFHRKQVLLQTTRPVSKISVVQVSTDRGCQPGNVVVRWYAFLSMCHTSKITFLFPQSYNRQDCRKRAGQKIYSLYSWIPVWQQPGAQMLFIGLVEVCGENSECTWGGNERTLVLTPSPVILDSDLTSKRFIETSLACVLLWSFPLCHLSSCLGLWGNGLLCIYSFHLQK